MKLSQIFFSTFFLVTILALCPAMARADCSFTTTGNVPLPDLGTGTYQGFQGGLYPGGTSVRPPAHEAAGIAAAAQVQPLDRAGNPDSKIGKIVLTSIGMSSVTQEWDTDGSTAFLPRANADPSKAHQVVIVDGAEGGKDATDWADPNDDVYTNFEQRLSDANVTRAQVQVAWLEDAIAYPHLVGGFPEHAQLLQGYLESILRNLKAICPNLRIVYLSARDRCYTDAPNALNPEPYAYETGFGVKWTIADQINGTGNLNFDPAKGAVVAPYVCWGPYVWADGTNPRSDGFTWECSDFEPQDYTHPSTSGTEKVASQLLAFFKTDPTSTPWFLKSNPTPPTLSASATPASGAAGTTFHFSASASDSVGTIVSYQWTFDDGTFSDAQNPSKVFFVDGDYTAHLIVTDSEGNYASKDVPVFVGKGAPPTPTPTPSPDPTPSPTPSPSPTPGPLVNVATRGEVGTGDMVLIGGFIVNGSGTKKLLLRAIGPSLGQANVAGPLADPNLELHDATGATIATNNDWQKTELGGVIRADQVAQIRASQIPPTDPRESAILADLAPGHYTAVVSGVGGSSGVALTELYDLDAGSSAQLANISTRGSVQIADEVLIGGFIIGDPNPSRVLVRAIGPSLTSPEINNALADPTLELRDENGALLASNDNWRDTQESVIAATGIAPTNAKESAILSVLPPGNYTATVIGKNGGTGVGLVEVYKLP